MPTNDTEDDEIITEDTDEIVTEDDEIDEDDDLDDEVPRPPSGLVQLLEDWDHMNKELAYYRLLIEKVTPRAREKAEGHPEVREARERLYLPDWLPPFLR